MDLADKCSLFSHHIPVTGCGMAIYLVVFVLQRFGEDFEIDDDLMDEEEEDDLLKNDDIIPGR